MLQSIRRRHRRVSKNKCYSGLLRLTEEKRNELLSMFEDTSEQNTDDNEIDTMLNDINKTPEMIPTKTPETIPSKKPETIPTKTPGMIPDKTAITNHSGSTFKKWIDHPRDNHGNVQLMIKHWDGCTMNTTFKPRVFPGQEWLKSKYDISGFDKDGYYKKRVSLPITDPLKRYNFKGFDMDGYDKEGYDQQGNGFNEKGLSKDGKFTCSGKHTIQLDETGHEIYDDEGYHKKSGFNRQGFSRDKKDLPESNRNKYYSNNGKRVYGDDL
jgi:hypothetical protein